MQRSQGDLIMKIFSITSLIVLASLVGCSDKYEGGHQDKVNPVGGWSKSINEWCINGHSFVSLANGNGTSIVQVFESVDDKENIPQPKKCVNK